MKRIGLIIERHWHYGRRLCEGVAEYARLRGDWALEFPEWSVLGDGRKLAAFDGFIARVWDAPMARALRKSGKPVINVYSDDGIRGFVTADQNALRIGQMAARHFIEHRFANFAYCGYAGQGFSTARRDAFRRALELNRLKCDILECKVPSARTFGRKLIARGDFDFGFDRKAVARWLRRLKKPTALFCAHDLLAWNILGICRRIGISVPSEISILGVDNDALLCDFTNPALSSIDPNPFGIGQAAAELLDRWFERPSERPDSVTVPPAGLIERVSTQAYPVSPPWLSEALVFIRRNVNRNLNANEVFRHLGLSHTVVEQAFRRKLGTSVRQEIAAVRIETAKHCLERTQLSLAEICTLSGFSSKPYFTTAFNAATGMTPLQWRTAHARPAETPRSRPTQRTAGLR